MTELHLDFGLCFDSLYSHEGIAQLDEIFLTYLKEVNSDLIDKLLVGRTRPTDLDAKSESILLIEVAPYLEDFLVTLFGIQQEHESLVAQHHHLASLYKCKRLFVQRYVAKKFTVPQACEIEDDILLEMQKLIGDDFDELTFSHHVLTWRQDEYTNVSQLEIASRYAAWALFTEAGQRRHRTGILFHLPHKIDLDHLIPLETIPIDGLTALQMSSTHRRSRDGFALTDKGTTLTGALDQANYCIWCHNQGKDSCSKGFKENTKSTKDGIKSTKGGTTSQVHTVSQSQAHTADKSHGFRVNALGNPLTGCLLEQKISEMNLLKAGGYVIGALAMVTVDNPMCAATGHRICNDCMKACIYQKQQPVDIPQVETRILKDVLGLPWGFEIYSLLTRWNPLDLRRPMMRPLTGYKILVVGLGPAGFTLSHHLMNEGHHVVGIDGLKIEPLEPAISGVLPCGERHPFVPIHDVKTLYERLEDRLMAGFGGVAEYGITVRWNKNFLKLIRLLLERRNQFTMIGGVRFGGTLTIDEAFAMGFDHIALCMGAGKPTVIPMKNGLVRGVRQASDFLMALQLTGVGKVSSIANLEIRLPIVVIGGGLTAIDTATEALAYYSVQVEKFLSRYEVLSVERGEANVRARWNAQECAIVDEFLSHARMLQAERQEAKQRGQSPQLGRLLEQWGGSTIVYRRRLTESPSYRLNHEEVTKALEEGIRFIEQVTPMAVETDSYDHACGLKVRHVSGHETVLPAKTILIAAGTQPNTVLAHEETQYRWNFDGTYFQLLDEQGVPVTQEKIAKPSRVSILLSLEEDGRGISFFGDLHPSFSGNVVKAMGGAKQGYPVLNRILHQRPATEISGLTLERQMNHKLRAVVYEMNRLTPTIVEVIIKAPYAVSHFKPGQFYRLQNFEALAPKVRTTNTTTTLAMEGLALTGAWVDKEQGLLSTIVLEMDGSSALCSLLHSGESVSLMGPTGLATEIPANETVCLIGGGLGNAVLFSIGQALQAKGSRVLYFAGYKKRSDRYKVDQIEAAAECIVWCCEESRGFIATRPSDYVFIGTVIDALYAYATTHFEKVTIPLSEVDRFMVVGSDRMMAAVTEARHSIFGPVFEGWT